MGDRKVAMSLSLFNETTGRRQRLCEAAALQIRPELAASLVREREITMFDLNSQLTSRKFQNNLEQDFGAEVDVGHWKHFAESACEARNRKGLSRKELLCSPLL